ncbi:trigger factor [Patescibacteria group bacterium AH-259-L07]|nr:trigger factor [Patescibacteria group bacterium AH-259-L07]
MEINTKKLPKNVVEIMVELSVLEMAPFNGKALEELAKSVEIPGFRKGKAPIEMARQYINEAKLLEKTAEITINQKYPEIIKQARLPDGQENLDPAGPPHIEIQKIAPHNPFIFKITLPLVPNVTLGDYKKIKVKKRNIQVNPENVDNALKELQWARRKETISLQGAKTGDRIEVDLNLFINNVPIEGGNIKNFSLILGQDERLLPGISKNFIGAHAGEEKEFSHQYPADHYDKKLAGQLVDFKTKINNIYNVELPELNDEFAQNCGDFKTLDELKDKIKQNLENEEQRKQEQRLELEILKQLTEKSDFEEMPEVLLNHEVDKMINELKASVERAGQENGPKFDDYLQSIKKTEDDFRKEFLPQAEERIKTALAIRAIAQQENIIISDDEIKQEMDKLAQVYKGQEKLLEHFKTEDGKIYLKNLLTNQKVIKYLKDNLAT